MRIGLYLMTEKGYEVLKVILEKKFKEMIAFVCVGTDRHVQNDFSGEIRKLCDHEKILILEREDRSEKMANCDLRIAVSWRWMIESEPNKLIVLHDSLLPRLRGFSPLVTAMINQDSHVGVTAIFAEEGFDRGPVILQKKLQLNYPIKIHQVINQIIPLYSEIIVEIFGALNTGGKLNAVKQDESLATYSLWRDESDYQINWELTAEQILAKINASSQPYAGASSIINNQLIRILDATVVDDVIIENRDCGKVLFTHMDKPIVVCGKGLLRIDKAVFENGESVLPLKNFRTRFK
ncbi:MAG: hypothetical protein JNJ99_12470 [Crocinitomicaceae bacterium]|nr:hypothetical protein [Crocinitomicaceae bacterium]